MNWLALNQITPANTIPDSGGMVAGELPWACQQWACRTVEGYRQRRPPRRAKWVRRSRGMTGRRICPP